MANGKMRVLYYSKKSKLKAVADCLCEKYGLKGDVVPPAYPCENERLLFLVATVDKDCPDVLRRFCEEINAKRAQNVALIIDGPETTAKLICKILKDAGSNPISKIFYCKTGFLKSKLTAEEKDSLLLWADEAVSSVND